MGVGVALAAPISLVVSKQKPPHMRRLLLVDWNLLGFFSVDPATQIVHTLAHVGGDQQGWKKCATFAKIAFAIANFFCKFGLLWDGIKRFVGHE